MRTNNRRPSLCSIKPNQCKLLSQGANGKVYVHPTNDKVVMKWFGVDDCMSSAISEYKMLVAANKINSVLVKAVGHDFTLEGEWLMMERLMPLQYRAIDVLTREAMYEEFVRQVKELHSNGLAHWDIKRPDHVASGMASWDNIILTEEGLRLIDAGNMVNSNDPDFEDAVEDDLDCLREFKEVFLQP